MMFSAPAHSLNRFAPTKARALVDDVAPSPHRHTLIAPQMPEEGDASLVVIDRYTRLYTGGKIDTHHESSDALADFFVCPCKPGVNVIDAATGRVRLVVSADEDEITTFALAASGRHLATASRSHQLRYWHLDLDGSSCECLHEWKAHKMPVMDMSFDSSGRLVASGSADASAMVFDVTTHNCTHVFRGHRGVLHLVRFHPEPSRLHLYTAAADNEIRAWDLRSRSCLAILNSHTGLPTALAFSSDGGTLFSAGRDQLVSVWSTAFGSTKKGDAAATPSPLKSIAVLEPLEGLVELAPADGQRSTSLGFVTAGANGLLRSWDAQTGRCLRKQQIGVAKQARPALTRLVRLGEMMIAATTDDNIVFHAAATMRPLRCIAGNNDEITAIKCLPGPPLPVGAATAEAATALPRLVVATNSAQLKLFDTSDMSCRLLFGHEDVVLGLDVSPDGRMIASSSKDCKALVWQADNGSCLAVCDGHIDAVGAVAFARRIPALLTASKDKTAKLWDLSTVYASVAGAARVVGDGAVGETANAEVTRARAKSTVLAHAKEINAVAMAPNDKLAVTASQDRLLKVWSVRDGNLVEAGTLKGHKRSVWCVAFSPVDKAVASGSGDMSIKIWSVSDFSCLRTLDSHTSSVLRVLWVRQGLHLLSSGSDGLIKLWTVKAAECACTLDAHEDKVWALDALESGESGLELWSGSADSLILHWRDYTQEQQHEMAEKHELHLQQEQELAIAVHAHQFDDALKLALRLSQPRSLRQVLERLLPLPDGESRLCDSLAAMADSELAQCLQFARDWNTTAQHSLIAQRLVHSLLKVKPISTLVATPNIQPQLEALLTYTERHFERLDRLMQGTQLLSFSLKEMQGMPAIVAEEDVDDE